MLTHIFFIDFIPIYLSLLFKKYSYQKASMKTIPTTSLEGTFIDASKKWKLGAQLGSGACGTVYELHRHRGSSSSSNTSPKTTNQKDSSKHPSFVIKIATLPSSLTSTSKKRKKTAQEKNADLLFHEHILYLNVLNTLRGTMVPDIPLPGYSSSVPPSFGEFSSIGSSRNHEQKYRYLIMERMEHSFTSYLIPLILQNKILVSHVFVRLIQLIQSIHDLNYVYIDVKPENFMIASNASQKRSATSSTNSSTQIAQHIRIIDVALMESTKDIMRNGKHRVDAYPDGQMVGTPTYASRNVMMGHTPSRRDDCEAIAYVMLELMLQVGAMASSKKTILQGDECLDVLPWSHGTSDDDVLQKKRNAVEEKDHGAFWNTVEEQVGTNARNCMKEYLNIVSKLEFKEKPDYEALIKLVNGIQLQLSSASSFKRKTARDGTMEEAKTTSRKKKSATVAKRTVEEKSPSIETTVHSPRAIRASTRNAKREKNQDIIVLDEDVDDSPNTPVNSSHDVDMKPPSSSTREEEEEEESIEAMDWERTTTTTKTTAKPTPFLIIECSSGPHRGESCILESSMVIGSHPKQKQKVSASSSDDAVFPLSKDSHISANHAKLILSFSGGTKKGVLMVKVTDLKSSSGTFLNGKELPKGGSRQAFVNDCIKVGHSELRIKKS